MEKQKTPRVVVCALIYNSQKEILLVQMKKWNDLWTVPGGHIEWGESMEDAVKREVKEETGLSVSNIEFSSVQESIFPKDYIEDRHLIMLDFYCQADSNEVVLNEEIQNFKWLAPKEALNFNLNVSGRRLIEKFLKNKNI